MERSARMRACGKPYASEESARNSKRGRTNPALTPEKCKVPGCGSWHLKAVKTSRTPAKSPARDTGPSQAVRTAVLERDGFACVCCGTPILGQRYSLAHRVRASQGGKATPENLVVLLGWGGEQCHGRVDLYKDPADGIGAKGYRLPSTADPAMEPVLIMSCTGDSILVWLTPHGAYSAEPPAEVAA